jgi:hypothetical protein
MMLARSLPFLLGAAMLAQAPKQQPGLLPGPVKPSELTVRLDLVGRIPTKTNPTSPAAAGADLLLVDQAGFVYRWDGTRASELITPRTAPSGLKLTGAESIVNVAANTTGTRVYVMFISTTVPGGIPKRTSPRDGTDAWYVLVEYDFRAGQLSAPRPITAMQVRTEGHVGGGMTVVDDGAVLFSPGDNGDSYEDGRDYSQDPAHHLAKILRINPADGATRIVAVGVRCSQRLAAYRIGGESWLTFVDPGGWISEELNAIKLTDLLDGAAPANFGWGRSAADGQAREGTLYIDKLGNSVGRIAGPEPGFRSPIAEFGREEASAIAITGPVHSDMSFSRISFLFGDLVSGALYAITGPPAASGQDVLRVNLVDSQTRPITLGSLAGNLRPDPRFFNFPDGSAGLLIERTGDFYRLTEQK